MDQVRPEDLRVGRIVRARVPSYGTGHAYCNHYVRIERLNRDRAGRLIAFSGRFVKRNGDDNAHRRRQAYHVRPEDVLEIVK